MDGKNTTSNANLGEYLKEPDVPRVPKDGHGGNAFPPSDAPQEDWPCVAFGSSFGPAGSCRHPLAPGSNSEDIVNAAPPDSLHHVW